MNSTKSKCALCQSKAKKIFFLYFNEHILFGDTTEALYPLCDYCWKLVHFENGNPICTTAELEKKYIELGNIVLDRNEARPRTLAGWQLRATKKLKEKRKKELAQRADWEKQRDPDRYSLHQDRKDIIPRWEIKN